MAKQRVHREWFRPLTKTTCDCGQRNVQVWSWGNYIRARWNTVKHFCQGCFNDQVVSDLRKHTGECGCTIQLVPYHCQLPAWLTLNPACDVAKAA